MARSLKNLDSEGRLFGAHVFTEALDGKLVDIGRELRESFELSRSSR